MGKNKDNRVAGREICVRLPLLSGKLTPKVICEGNYMYISAVDLERLETTIGLYQKPLLNDRCTGWLKNTSREFASSLPSFTGAEVAKTLAEQLDYILGIYPSVQEDKSLKVLLDSIYKLGNVLLAAENRNFKEVEASLEQYTYGVVSAISQVVSIVGDLRKKEQENESLTFAFDHQDERDQKYLMRCAEEVNSYFDAIQKLLAEEKNLNASVTDLNEHVSRAEALRRSLRTKEEELDDEVAMHILGNNAGENEEMILKLSAFQCEAVSYNEDRLTLIALSREIRSSLSGFSTFIREAKTAKTALNTYLQEDEISKLPLQNWTSEEKVEKAKQWISESMHESDSWTVKLSGIQRRLAVIDNLLSNSYDDSKIQEWTSILAIKSPMPIPDPTSATVLDFRKMAPPAVDGKRPIPQTVSDMFELLILSAAARTNSTNYLWSTTFQNTFSVMETAGFDLQYIDRASFREFFRNHHNVASIDYDEAKDEYLTSRKSLLTYRVPDHIKGTTASRERIKITRAYANSSDIQEIERRWGITCAEIKGFADTKKAERSDLYEKRKLG